MCMQMLLTASQTDHGKWGPDQHREKVNRVGVSRQESRDFLNRRQRETLTFSGGRKITADQLSVRSVKKPRGVCVAQGGAKNGFDH